MNIAPISSINNSQIRSQKNVNFGVKLFVEDSIPRFFVKEAGNYAVKYGYQVKPVMNNAFNALVYQMSKLLKKVEPIEPEELPLTICLTPKAQIYANDEHLNGITYGEFDDSIQLNAPSPFGGYITKSLNAILPDEESMNRIEKEIKTMADVVKPFLK